MTNLKEKTDKEILKSHGKPTIIRQELDKQMWVYREKECTFLIFFDTTGIVQFAESRGNCPKQK